MIPFLASLKRFPITRFRSGCRTIWDEVKDATPVQALTFSCNGTVMDRYSIATREAFRLTFALHDVHIRCDEALPRANVTTYQHLKYLLLDSPVNYKWCDSKLSEPSCDDLLSLYKDFNKLYAECLRKHSRLVPGAAQILHNLRYDHSLKLALVSSVLKPQVCILQKESIRQGFRPDAFITTDKNTPLSSDSPFGIYKALTELQIYPIKTVVHIADTVEGIQSGLNAGCWTIGVSRYSTLMDIHNQMHENTLSESQLEKRTQCVKDKLRGAGAHYVVTELTDLSVIIRTINDRLYEGDTPISH